jgi:ABC-2 type transport system ATP-binding protein
LLCLTRPAIIARVKGEATLIETRDLTKRFGDLDAVVGLSLRVSDGSILALLGPNGAGKTTTIRMLASILRPTSGEARIAGYDVRTHAADVRRSVGLLTEHHGLYTRMRAEDYLQFFGQIYGLGAEDCGRRIQALLGQFGLWETRELRLGEYSKGMRQKLALARALLHEPPVLLLDEPTSAMDPASAHHVRSSITQLRQPGRTIVVCTHNLGEAESLADEIAIIHKGRIIAQGTAQDLKREYLGDPIMELRLATTLDGAVKFLPPGVTELASGENWLRFRVARPEEVNPGLLRSLSQAGVPVVTLSEVPRTLEDVYLQVVGEQDEKGLSEWNE